MSSGFFTLQLEKEYKLYLLSLLRLTIRTKEVIRSGMAYDEEIHFLSLTHKKACLELSCLIL